MSFAGKKMLLFLRKHADKIEEDVLEPSTEGEGIWGKLGSLTGVKKKAEAHGSAVESADDDRIHVFTVASGHMYERLQKIMILSVIKRTEKRVKFWFIKNYMSPQVRF